MDLPEKYSRFLLKNLGCRAVWLPNEPFVPGDYGVFKDGIWRRLGHLTEDYDIPVGVKPGGRIHIDLTSSATRVTQYHGDAMVKLLTKSMSGKGSLEINFKKEHSFFLRARNCTSRRVASTVKLSKAIARKVRDWKHLSYWVLSQVYSAPSAILLASRNANSTVKIGGEVQALVKVFDGKVSSGLQISGTSNLSLAVQGEKGPVLLRVFRVRMSGSPVVK